ncbi:MAG: hypothetical protein Q8908_12430 [Bacteroidota bacterium]|nr:hypothetical protein [Bacteroidota bacterium]
MKNILIGSLLLIMCAFSCEKIAEHKYAIKFYNHSTKSVMIVEGMEEVGLYLYPDTTLPTQRPFLIQVIPNNYGEILSSNKWADEINSIPSHILSIYVFSSDTIKAYDWSKIKSGYKVLKRYDLSLGDLQKSNWTITYP